MLFPQLIKANLKTKSFGRHIEYFQKLDSTNKEAKNIIDESKIKSGSIIITDFQYDGKGRNKKKWYASSGKSITFSLIFKPEFELKKINLLSLVVGIAIANTMKKLNVDAKLKWPNDIFINDKKCGGILIESKISKNKIKYLIIGIGININENQYEFDSSLENIVTSLYIEKGSPIQRELIVAYILNELEKLIETLNHKNSKNIIDKWKKLCGHINKKVNFLYNKKPEIGIFKDINDNGEAIIEIGKNDIILNHSQIFDIFPD
tara:strand:- start:231 stop:1019 length:789 start_codon:yes stop_codon:yes gene_type:complete